MLVAALPTIRELKMANNSTAQKSKKRKNSGSTTGSAGTNKNGTIHKPSSRPSKNPEESSNEGSELLKFESMLIGRYYGGEV